MKTIVRNIQNNDLYEYVGDNKFRNIRTGNEGELSDEVAQKVFKINLEATQLFGEYTILTELVQRLGLKFDNNKK